jgi:hypothetical protein
MTGYTYVEFAVEGYIGKLVSCVIPTQNYACSKQTSFRIMAMERYTTLDMAKHNTANTRHLILAAVM